MRAFSSMRFSPIVMRGNMRPKMAQLDDVYSIAYNHGYEKTIEKYRVLLKDSMLSKKIWK